MREQLSLSVLDDKFLDRNYVISVDVVSGGSGYTYAPDLVVIDPGTGVPFTEGKLAAEIIAGSKKNIKSRVIPSVAYTDPEIAWVGLTETEAKLKNIDYGKGVFPWAANGRSLALARDEGITKILFDKQSKKIIGAAIVGTNAGDLIAECVLAIEMNSNAKDIAQTIHPHPTLSETNAMAAEVFEGTITDLYIPKR